MKHFTCQFISGFCCLTLIVMLGGCINADLRDVNPTDLGAGAISGSELSDQVLIHNDLLPTYQNKINVSNSTELKAAVREANKTGNAEIILKSGSYTLDSILLIQNDNITVRSQTGKRDDVTIKGWGMWSNQVGFIFVIFGKNVAIGDMTIGAVRYHAIQVRGEDDADNVLIHNLRIFDTGEQMVKVSYNQWSSNSADNGIVRDCEFVYTRGQGPRFYIGGIDAHQAHGWTVKGNVFKDIKSPNRTLAEHAIHFWTGSSNTTIVGNTIIDCDRGIGLGLGDRTHGSAKIYNNMVYTTRDVGIGLESADGVEVYHNTVVSRGYPFSIEYRFAETNAIIKNNITSGLVQQRDGGNAVVSSNVVIADTTLFKSLYSGDLHLNMFHENAQWVIDQAELLPEVPVDFDGQHRPRGRGSEIGADEVK